MTSKGPVAVFPTTTTANNALQIARALNANGTAWAPVVTIESTVSQKKQSTVVEVRPRTLCTMQSPRGCTFPTFIVCLFGWCPCILLAYEWVP